MKSLGIWYNGAHPHSAIRFVTPNMRHLGQERETLANPAILYANAVHKNQNTGQAMPAMGNPPDPSG